MQAGKDITMKDLETILKEWDRITGTHHDPDPIRKHMKEHDAHEAHDNSTGDNLRYLCYKLVEIYGEEVWMFLDFLVQEEVE
jgi:hypothetical protein